MAAGKPDLSEFFQYSKPKKKPCRIGFVLSQLKGQEAVDLEGACAEGKGLITNAAIQEWLAKRKHEASVSAIVSHRKGTCSCGD